MNTKEIDPKTGLPTGARVQTLANKGKWEAQSLSKLKETTEKALTKNDKTKLQFNIMPIFKIRNFISQN